MVNEKSSCGVTIKAPCFHAVNIQTLPGSTVEHTDIIILLVMPLAAMVISSEAMLALPLGLHVVL